MILRRIVAAAVSLVFTAMLAARVQAQQTDGAVTVTNQDGVARRFSVSELRAMPQVEVKGTNAEGTSVFRGPSVRALLTLAGAPAGQSLRGPSMQLVIVAEGSDGYKAVYALAELDEQFGARKVVLAITQDGRPLADADGPYRLVVDGEEHRARWVRKVVALKLVRAG